MQRKPGFPVTNCSIKMPECSVPTATPEAMLSEEDGEQQQRRQQLINFGHSQWGFNNWSWSVSKQELDFVDFSHGKYCAGVVAFVSITVKTCDIHRENIGYATSVANTKGFAIYKSRKCAVTNALRETLLSFGGNVATELTELEASRPEHNAPTVATTGPEVLPENNQNVANRPTEPKNSPLNRPRKEPENQPANVPTRPVPIPTVKNTAPVAKAHPMPANLPQPVRPTLAARPPNAPRPNSNVSFLLQPVVGGTLPPIYRPPVPPHMFQNAYYEYPGPWHFAYESYDRAHGNVNLNFNLPPKNLVVNGRAGTMDCSRQEGEALHYAPPPPSQGCWIKPTIFYDGFWTEQKVKKWVAEQVEKQFPDDAHASSPAATASDQPPAKS